MEAGPGSTPKGSNDEVAPAIALQRALAAPPGSQSVDWLQVPLEDRSYGIAFQAGGRHELGTRIAQLFPGARRTAVVTNPTVGSLYFSDVSASLVAAGLSAHRIDIPDSETAKSLQVAERVIDQLITARFERSEPVIALGGGVVGDLAGFVASIYLRSVPYV